VARALDGSARRLAELLARERAFSADVSHQLRTPLAGLRLRLERAARDDGVDRIDAALAEVDRLESTLDHLLALARDSQPVSAALPAQQVVADAADRWAHPYEERQRRLAVRIAERLPAVRASAVSLGQVLDVLLDNALRHGGGTVYLTVRAAAGGVVIEVADEGEGIADDRSNLIFDRRHGTGTGIGLGLARTITEAEGARLLLVQARPPRFHVVLTTDPA
jgi:signal transduction histidine kinase